MLNSKSLPGLSSFSLHLLAMGLMLCDHLWATVLSRYDFLTWIGRIAFPIFAFLLVEGYFHTGNLRKYMLRLLLWALASELPFNLMYSGSWFYPFHQNVLWTFLLGLCCIHLIERQKQAARPLLTCMAFLLWGGLFYGLAFLTMVDYFGYGIAMVLVFYLFRGRSRWCMVGQLLGLFWINVLAIGGLSVPVILLGHTFLLPQQSLACLALLPIWLYRGRQGPHSRGIQIGFYAFYPLHMLILAFAALQ